MAGDQWCDAEVLRILRRRSLAALRAQVEPVEHRRLRPVPARVAAGRRRTQTSGIDGLAAVIDQLAGVPIPASAVEPLVFGLRVRDYHRRCSTNCWPPARSSGRARARSASGDGWIAFHPADSAPLTLARRPRSSSPTRIGRSWRLARRRRGLLLPPARSSTGVSTEAFKEALWELIWAGWVTGDTFAPVRALLGGTRALDGPARAPPPAAPPRLSRYSVAHAQTRTTDRRSPAAGRRCRPPNRIRPSARTSRPTCCSTATAC